MIKGIIIGLLIYSFINTAIVIYKDCSSYFIVEALDYIVAGPFLWIIMLLVKIFSINFERLLNKNPKPKSKAKIKRIVKRTYKHFTKYCDKYSKFRPYIDFQRKFIYDNYCGIEGYNFFLIKKPIYELLNKDFEYIIKYQYYETIPFLQEYFRPLNEEEISDLDDEIIDNIKNKDRIIYTLK